MNITMQILQTTKKAATKLFTAFSFRLYLLYFIMVGGSAWVIATHSLKALETSVSQVAEEVLVDVANLLASFAERDIKNGRIDTKQFSTLIPNYLARSLNANIHEHRKYHTDLQVYITNDKGVVLYDSTNRYVGKNFIQWRDVNATLAGRYGARVSSLNNVLDDDAHDNEKGLFVSAPISYHESIIGSLTVVKANRNLNKYLLLTNRELIIYATFVMLTSLIAGAFITWWLWRSIRKLSRYANQLGSGEYSQQPKIIHNEFKPLASAMENMYEQLAGKEYVENYIHTLAHELKSPLTGVLASTELLQQDLPDEVRKKFTQTIHDSATRMTVLIDCLLNLASLEKRHALTGVAEINLVNTFKTLISERELKLAYKCLTINSHFDICPTLRGEPTLIAQSLANLLNNAIDFSLAGGYINITIKYDEHDNYPFQISIHDCGEGIAPFAEDRLFERFYSTPRPDTQQRSSGLGLAFVKEAISLHQGVITLENHTKNGALAIVKLPQIKDKK